MSEHEPPDITVTCIVRTAQDWHQAGVIGAANVRLDGKALDPIFLVRDMDGHVRQYLSIELFSGEIPECVQDASVRRRIWEEVDDAVQVRDAEGSDI